MVSEDHEIVKIRQELDHVDDLLWRHYKLKGSWTLRLGPIHITPNFTSKAIIRACIVFIIVCATTGGALTFIEPTKELGIALLAGAILAFGSFISQLWAIAIQREMALRDAFLAKAKNSKMENLWERREILYNRIEAIEKESARRRCSRNLNFPHDHDKNLKG